MSDIQAVLFQKKYWDGKNARAWLKQHGFKPIKKAHVTEHFLRYRIQNPKKFSRFANKKIPKDHIELIFGFL